MTASPATAPDTTRVPAPPEVSAVRLLATLGTAGAAAGLLLVFVFGWTLPRIEANRARYLDLAVREVLGGPDRYEPVYVLAGGLSRQPPPGTDVRTLERLYLGYGADSREIGFAIVAAEPGFQDVIQLIFGYDRRARRLLGMKVLESKETPGLGDKIEKDPVFVGQFAGAQAPLVGVKRREGQRSDPREVHMITGATISSRAVIRMINGALERLGPLIEGYRGDGQG
jgi:electron transport complex protein RnfG